MFNAIASNDEEICILDFEERDREDIRLRAKDDDFHCPICNFCLNVRLGDERCWHFAHRESGPNDCPMRHRDAAGDGIIAMLYRWLKCKSAIRDIAVDYIPNGIKSEIPIDLFFRTDKQSYLYKVLMKRIGFEQWDAIEDLKSRYCLNFVFPESSMRKNGKAFLLNPNQRDSIRFSAIRQRELGLESNLSGYLLMANWQKESFYKLQSISWVGPSIREYNAEIVHIPIDKAFILPRSGEIVLKQQ